MRRADRSPARLRADLKLLAVTFLAVGALGLGAALVVGGLRAAWLSHARHAEGRVTQVERQMSTLTTGGGLHHRFEDADPNPQRILIFRPVVTFTAEDGRAVRITGTFWSSDNRYQTGDVVKVDYPPERPDAGVIQDVWQRWFAAGVLALLGAIFGGVGAPLALIVRMLPKSRPAAG